MKKLYSILFLIPIISSAQTVTSVAVGNYYSPATWDCTCIPNDSDTIYINHAVTLNLSIAYTGGLLQVGGAGSLTDGGAGNSILIDGGKVTNIGTINCSGLLLESGHLNNLAQLHLDSLQTRDTVSNMGIINIEENFKNDLNGNFTNWGTIDIGNNFLNEAIFFNNSNLEVHNDFANCNMAGSEAYYKISGFMCVYNDFLNCADDTITGNGTITIGGASNNAGEMEGNFIINTSNGSLTSNTGNIATGISFGIGNCTSGLLEENTSWVIYPNPAENSLTSTEAEINYEVYDFSGRLILSAFSFDGNIQVEFLIPGIYAIRMVNVSGQTSTSVFSKK
jgi:hypothetical protein